MNGHLVNGFTSTGNESSEDSDDDMPLELPPSPKVFFLIIWNLFLCFY